MRPRHPFALVLLALLGSPARSQGQVLVVDAAGSTPYTQISSALAAAAPGDVLLVKGGSYASFAVANQSVAVVGDAGAIVQVNGTIQVRNLAADRRVLLHRLRAFGATSASPNDGPGITLKNDLGTVRVQGCYAQGAPAQQGVRIEGSSDVALFDVQAQGGVAWPLSGDGLLAHGTALVLHGADVHGGAGAIGPSGQYPNCSGGSGGIGLRSSVSGFLCLAATLVGGGAGHAGMDGCCCGGAFGACCYGGNGAQGLRLVGGTHTLWQRQNLLQGSSGGAGGFGMCGCGISVNCGCDDGVDATAFQADAGDTQASFAGASADLGASVNPVREGAEVVLTIDTTAGDVVALFVAQETTFQPQSGRGVRLVAPSWPHLQPRLATANAAGRVELGWIAPELGSGVESRIVHLQALARHANGQLVWSNALALVLLDSAF